MPMLRTALQLVVVASAVLFAAIVHAKQPEVYAAIVKGTAVGGYDAVAYFTDKKAVKGSPKFTFSYKGVNWRFANEKNLGLFKENPEAYAPQYGGYCTGGVAGGHAAVNVDPETAWRIIDGKLYIVYDPTYVADLDRPDRGEVLAKAEANWPSIKEQLDRDPLFN